MSDLPRLLLCSFDVVPGPSGGARRIAEYLKGLGSRFNVVVLSTKPADQTHIARFEGARILRVPVGEGELASRAQAFDRAVRRQLESEEFDLVHFTDPFGGYALCELRERYGYKVVYEARTFPSNELRWHHPSGEVDLRFHAKLRRQELFCLMNADRVITGAEVTRGFIHGLGVAREQVQILTTPVNLMSFARAKASTAVKEGITVGYLGSSHGWQGLATLLEAIHQARARADVRGLVIGPRHPEWTAVIEGQLEALGLADRVELRGFVPEEELARALAPVDAFALPLSAVERNVVQGSPLAKAADYLAVGRPVLASDLPICREFLPAEGTFFHRPGDATQLAEDMVKLAGDPSLRAHMGAVAHGAARRHDAARVCGLLLASYSQLLGRTPPRGSPAPSEGEDARTQLTRGASEGTEHVVVPSIPPARGASARHRTATLPVVAAPAPGPPAGAGLPRVDRTTLRMDTFDPEATLELPAVLPADLDEPEEFADDAIISALDAEDLAHLEEHACDEGAGGLAPPVEGAPAPAGPLPAAADPEHTLRLPEPSPVQDKPSGTGAIDPWLAQLVHGYCPPEGAQFARHTPPTNFPGREGPPPPTAPPPGGSVRSSDQG